MTRQMSYASEDVDLIQPRNEQERRVLALAVKHGLLTPMMWDTPPTHFGSNRPSFAEICAFAADVTAGVAAVAPAAWMHEFKDPHTGERRCEPRLHKPKDYDLLPSDTVRPLVYADGVALGANASPDYTDEPWQDALLERAVAAGFKRDAHGDWIVPGGLDTTELLALLSGLPLPERYTCGMKGDDRG